MTDRQDPVTRAVELFVYAPIGAGLFLLDEGPGILEAAVERGRSSLDAQITTARSTGEVAIAFGVPMLRRKVEGRVNRLLGRDATPPPAAAKPTPEPAPAPAPSAPEPVEPFPAPAVMPSRPWAPAPAPPPRPPSTHVTPANGAPSSSDLPIPGYDELSASQVVERLVGLAPDELDAVHSYETANRRRRTILGKIEQLAASNGV